jgi:hypothetical protein
MIRPMRRSTLTALLLALTGLLIGDCGDSQRPARALQKAYANAVNLHEGDLGPPSGRSLDMSASTAFEARLKRCGGFLPGIEAVSFSTGGFVPRGSLSVVSSAVRVMDSAAAARRAIAADREARLRDCVASAYRTDRVDNKEPRVTVSPLDNPWPDSFGLNVTVLSETVPKRRYALLTLADRSSTDILGFAYDSAEVGLSFTYKPGVRRDRRGELRLLALLYARAKRATPILTSTTTNVLIIK